jgi:hypothetical protein
LRKGTSINPFWPTPQGKGSISADITIPDYRKEPVSKTNIFAVIEIKFPGDPAKSEQFNKYAELSDSAATAKTDAAKPHRLNGGSEVSKGFRLALFRYPEDLPEPEKKPDGDPNKGENAGRGKSRRRKKP